MNKVSLKARIRDYEGCELKAYDDSLGYRTIGIGYLLDCPEAVDAIERLGLDFKAVYRGDALLTEEHCDVLLDQKLDEAIQTAQELVPNFDDHPHDVQDVLVDMAYNLGRPKLARFVKMLAAFKAMDYCTAQREMSESLWARQVGRRALDNIAAVRLHCPS
jgi:lysozyme